MKRCAVLLMLLLIAGCWREAPQWQAEIHARKGELTQDSLILGDVDQLVALFSGREIKESKTISMVDFVQNWDTTFKGIQPQATLSYFSENSEYKWVDLFLSHPKYKEGRLVFEIEFLQEHPAGKLGETVVFIINISQDQLDSFH